MAHQLRKALLIGAAVALLAISGLAKADPLVGVFSLEVTNPAAFMGAMEQLLASDTMRDHNVTLWASVFDGTDPATHVVVAQFEDYEDFEELTQRRLTSPDWSEFLLSGTDVWTGTATLMAIQRVSYGDSWQTDGAAAAVIMTVRDPATYTDAFKRVTESYGNPGSVRLMEIRAGGEGATHAVLYTAEGMAELNEYIDGLLGSDEYRAFVGEVGDIRTINTVNMFSRVKTWGN